MKKKNSNILLRLARIDEASVVASILSESFAEYMSLYTREGMSATTPSVDKVVTRMQEGPVWVATVGNRVLCTVSAVPKDDGLYVRGMAVLPRARGHAVGSRLLDQIIKYARENHHKRLYLSTTPFLTHAIRLYERYGFKRIAEQPADYFGTPIFRMEMILGILNDQLSPMGESK